jgi:ABC-type multidrug transport system fused ATPase/permease subunit
LNSIPGKPKGAVKEDLVVLRKLLTYFPKRDRFVFFVALGIQFLLSIIDVLALFVTGLLAGLVITYSTGSPLPKSMVKILDFIGIKSSLFNHPSRVTLGILGSVIVVSLVGRTIASLMMQRKILNMLANRQTYLARRFGDLMAHAKYPWVRQSESNNLVYALTDGINDLVLVTVGNVLTLSGEMILISLICLSFLVININLLLLLVLFAIGLSVTMHYMGSRRAFALGNRRALAVVSARYIAREEIDLYRELTILDKASLYRDKYQAAMLEVAQSSSKYLWIQQIPKYLLEISVVLVGILLLLFSTSTAGLGETSQAISIFFLGLLRVGPSLLRLQGALSGFRNSIGGASIAFKQLEELSQNANSVQSNISPFPGPSSPKNTAAISITDMSFRYPNQTKDLFENFSLEVGHCEKLAIVGPSGGGKSTLCDLILGLNEPLKGGIFLEGISPSNFLKQNPGSVGLVPQSVIAINATLAENVALGCPIETIDFGKVEEVCQIANLEDLLNELQDGFLTRIGEGGVQLSGGQKQRLGLARALYTDPRLLILDEPTSALDSASEKKLFDAFNNTTIGKTVIVIAHRLSTVKSMDRLLYLDHGSYIVADSIEQLRLLSPDFERQASLLNL